MHPRSKTAQRAGDYGRLLRECLGSVFGSVALITGTAPGGTFTASEGSSWNRGAAKRWRAFQAQLRAQMWRRYGVPPPRVICRVAQRQKRGLDHLHLIALCRTLDERERIRLWVGLYREYSGHYGFGFVDDPFHERRGKDGQLRDMVFRSGRVAGIYLGRYLHGGQLERFLAADDASFRPVWISPVLLARSGWSLARCQWLRQAWHLRNGTWRKRTWYGSLWLPGWWLDGEQRAWVLAVTGWDGLPLQAAPGAPG